MTTVHNPTTRYTAPCDAHLSQISDVDLRHGIGLLFAEAQRRVQEDRVTIVVIAARRLACLYQLLVRAGMPRFEGCLVVSDRVLDTNPFDDWIGQRVLVLDDSVIVGTTLSRLHETIAERIGAGDVSFLAVCRDLDQSVDFLLKDLNLTCLYERHSGHIREFSVAIVRALFEHQVPFFADYPTTRAIELSLDSWRQVLHHPGWSFADVTAPLLASTGRYTLAQIPTQETFTNVLTRLIPEVTELVDVFKVRHYVHQEDDEVRIVLVPLTMVSPCRPSRLIQVLETICATNQCEALNKLEWRKWKPEAQHRLLQLYVSACVLEDVWSHIEEKNTGSELSRDDLEPLQVELYFGAASDTVLSAFNSIVQQFRKTEPASFPEPVAVPTHLPPDSPLLTREEMADVLWDTRELIADMLPAEPETGELTKLGFIFSHGITSLFGFIYRVYEIPEREEIAKLGSRENYDATYGDPNKRLLNQGFTMRELTAALVPEGLSGSPWCRALVSLGIDAGNDLGIIVPKTRYSEVRDVVYRCYRLGETAHLADRPLIETIQTDLDKRDDLTRCVEEGYSVEPETVPVDTVVDSAGRYGALGSLKELELTAHLAVPGTIEMRYFGSVTEVDEVRFGAVLDSPDGRESRVASLLLDQLSDFDRSELTVGSKFSWSLLVNDRSGKRDRISRIRLHPVVEMDEALLARRADVFRSLLLDDEQTAEG